MTRIRVLDEDTVNKIAAGEVIERPASVVKELVENSLDAGATGIIVRIKGAGKEIIEVADDGCGMSADDLKLAFVQHATSKLHSIEDLETLRTMGFRGEALSSIAAVAVVEVTTRERASDLGHSVTFRGGRPGEVGSAGRPWGTTVTVKGLFSGHPARLKYLKSDRVELARIIDIVTERAIVHPGVAFRLVNEDADVMNLPRSELFKDRIVDVLGRGFAKGYSFFETTCRHFRGTGYLGNPELSKSTREGIYLYVNSRPVASQLLTEALESGYEGMLMKNRHPVAVIMLDIDPARMDVNVHPTKRQVRFADGKEIGDHISRAVAIALGNGELIPAVSPKQEELFPVWLPPDPAPPKKPERKGTVQKILGEDFQKPTEVAKGIRIPAMRVIGQILDTYILAQSGVDLLIIDQHAAHERIMLEKLKAGPQRRAAQKLITPVPLALGKREIEIIEHYREIIEGLGFAIEPFGKDTYLVRAVPSMGGHLETEQGLRDLIGELAELGKAKSIKERRDEIMHLVACHSAIRAGEPLTQQMMAHLVEEMKLLDNPFTCAHGRPTIIRITGKELEKMFKRIV